MGSQHPERSRQTDSGKPLRVWIAFDEPEVGSSARRRYSPIINHLQCPPNWTQLEPTVVSIKRNKSSNLQVLRKQFPLVPAEAMTIHKSQGQTYPSVVVHLTARMTCDLLYVALSRATSLSGLFIIGSFQPPRGPQNNDPLVAELRRQEQCVLLPKFKFLRSTRSGI
ncbi:unnamed protein product [Gongylonema pulchrum]|uniref:UvrD_C_2 domain-containing protein n=1 Tax=Gongylonema pulchrum TaxID=637853 RepID=A0A183DYK2_9BILA|nr:unnamed protein product [Gongylonema pulchrum]